VRWAYHDNKEILKFIRGLAPELIETERRNNRCIDLTEWYAVATEVRHAVTHSDMIIKSHRIRSWSGRRSEILARFFPGAKADGDYALKLGRTDAETNLCLFAEYAFTAFKSLSKSKSYNWRIFTEEIQSEWSQQPPQPAD
jgi:hypothetical protein